MAIDNVLHAVEERLLGMAGVTTPTPVTPTPTAAAPTLDLPPAVTERAGAGKGLKPWIEAALPHPDVLANRFKEAEFAADLFAVDAGHATED